MVVGTHSSTHPPLPPTTEDARLSWLRLLRSRRVGPATFFRLISEHGSPQAALEALPEVAAAAGARGYAPCPEDLAIRELRRGERIGARPLFFGASDYPASLLDLPDAPPLLWALGDTLLLTRPAIALVGARNASSLALRMAGRLAGDLGRSGLVTVSGLARGIDAAVHAGSLDSGTIAVQAGGVDIIYPLENTDLARRIEQQGLRLSEQPLGLAPVARHFPMRNRLISGLARAVVVVEAAAKSGSLLTARNALDQGRDVLAVPGHPFDARAAGCNLLLRDGATLVRGASDVLEALGPAPAAHAPPERPSAPPVAMSQPAPKRRPLRDISRLHMMILDRLGPSPMEEDALIRDMEAPANAVAPALTDLELEGRIERQPGGRILRLP